MILLAIKPLYYWTQIDWDMSGSVSLKNTEPGYAYIIRNAYIEIQTDANVADRYIRMIKRDPDGNYMYITNSPACPASNYLFCGVGTGMTTYHQTVIGSRNGCILGLPQDFYLLHGEELKFECENEQAADSCDIVLQYSKVRVRF